MLFGPNLIFKCPQCSTLHQKQTLASGNNFGAIYFSDGLCLAPMLPPQTRITACTNCNKIFWLSTENQIGSYDYNEPVQPEWLNAPDISFPQIDVIFKAVQNKYFSSPEQEYYLRLNLWQMLNHRKPENNKEFSSEHPCYKENALKLAELLNTEIPEECLTAAEVKRNLGEFADALRLIESIKDDNFQQLIPQYREMCVNQKSEVFRLK